MNNNQISLAKKYPSQELPSEENYSIEKSEFGNGDIENNNLTKMTHTKLRVFQEQISLSRKLIFQGKTFEALALLKEIILGKQYLDHFEFVGLGLRQNWEGIYPKGIIQWITEPYTRNQTSSNPFDLFSICLSIELVQRKMKTEEALLIYDELGQSLSQCFEIVVGRGIVLYNGSQFLESQKQFMKASQMRESQKVLEYLAWIVGYKFLIDEQGIKCCQKVLQLNPENVHIHYLKAFCIDDNQQRNAAMRILLQKYPYYYRAYLNLGNSENEVDNKRNAYQKALQFDPSFGLAYCALSLAYFDVDTSLSLEYLQKALKINLQINANESRVLAAIGKIYRKLKLRQQAEYYLKKCLQICPYNYVAMQELALIYEESQNINGAIEILKRLIEVNPYSDHSITKLANICDEHNKNAEALDVFKNAIKLRLQHEDWYLYFRVGYLYNDMEQYSLAIPYYLNCQRLHHIDKFINFNLAICYFNIKEFKAAKKQIKIYLANGGDYEIEIYDLLRKICTGEGEYKQAVQWFFKLIAKKQRTETFIFLKDLIDKISKAQWMELLDEIHQQEGSDIYVLLQISILYLHFDDFEKVLNIMSEVEQLSKTVELNEWVRQYLRQFQQKYASRGSRFILMKKYEHKFRSFYES